MELTMETVSVRRQIICAERRSTSESRPSRGISFIPAAVLPWALHASRGALPPARRSDYRGLETACEGTMRLQYGVKPENQGRDAQNPCREQIFLSNRENDGLIRDSLCGLAL